MLVKVGAEETKTRGGILLPTSAIKKPTSGARMRDLCTHQRAHRTQWDVLTDNNNQVHGTAVFAGDVVALGDGRGMDGTVRTFALKTGDTVRLAVEL